MIPGIWVLVPGWNKNGHDDYMCVNYNLRRNTKKVGVLDQILEFMVKNNIFIKKCLSKDT